MIPDLEQTFRWFGPSDPVTLQAIKQTGATGIVSALHHIPSGEVWSKEEIDIRKNVIENAGFNWAVVESVNIHESIKLGKPDRDKYIENYIETLKNLSEAGINTICYNFMPVLDWTRTHLDYRLPSDASALRYEAIAVAAFDLYILEREAAFNEFTKQQQAEAKSYLDSLTKTEIELLTNTVLAGLPGTDEVFTIPEFKEYLNKYKNTDSEALKENLFYFLRAIIPSAEKLGVKMCIHPDDPPFPILGLPRVASTEQDLAAIVNACPSVANGITLCTGSLGARADNNIPGIISRLGEHIHFLHLRNVQREASGSFFEAEHLDGSTDIFAVMKAIIEEQLKREKLGRGNVAIPMRPDHGHKILDDFNYNTYPGYSVIGRLKGLAELRGLEMGIKRSLDE
ncbi:mannonate dehydratase [Mucilaginibacter agri]|uniref:Mannonate dehydratase n=1 Tax=Mucilaginibacter agri TaxID=2695265 RepID=A0A966DV11_9SPHI|nr:mannonate dehydratase [Mucilaginibacter agri]NCD71002.1 mannonate dehydratase [Mucilaginibacter agri]